MKGFYHLVSDIIRDNHVSCTGREPLIIRRRKQKEEVLNSAICRILLIISLSFREHLCCGPINVSFSREITFCLLKLKKLVVKNIKMIFISGIRKHLRCAIFNRLSFTADRLPE